MKYQNKLLVSILLCSMASCGKSFLDVKRNASQVVPESIADYQAILDLRSMFHVSSSALALIGSDEYFLTNSTWQTINQPYQRNGYIWADEVFEGAESPDWNHAYERILYANLAMEVDKIKPSTEEQAAWDNVKGTALFQRAWNYYQLAQLFCLPYNGSTAHSDPGIPLRVEQDISVSVGRGTVAQLYEQIISDASRAAALLPDLAVNKFRPNKASAFLLLAKTYLHMGLYEDAEVAADHGLQSYSQLLNFNELDSTKRHTFEADYGDSNPEVLYYTTAIGINNLYDNRFNADSTLLDLYHPNDLRRHLFFHNNQDGRVLFKGSYSGDSFLYFTGLSTNELWLVRAECRIRRGKILEAIDDLNFFLKHRYKTDGFHPIELVEADVVLATILSERRKELYLRGARWEDARRLNSDAKFATSFVRHLDGTTYKLDKHDLKWVWPIPDNEIDLNGLHQNPR